MSRLDKMRKIFESNSSTDAATPIDANTSAEKILETLFDKAIPLRYYYDGYDIAEAILDDAIDEGLSASEICDTIPKLIVLDKYKYTCEYILDGVNLLAAIEAKEHLESERSTDKKKQDDEERISPKEV